MLWKKESNKRNAYVDLCATSNYMQNKFEMIYNQMFANAQSKNNEIAHGHRMKGNYEFAMKNWNKAMTLYNLSLAFAKNETESVSLAYANRSVCFFHLKLYEKCLVDINLAKKSNYPKRLMPKLEQREADCLKLIELNASVKPFIPELSFETNEKFPGMANILEIELGGQLGRRIKAKQSVAVGQLILIEEGFVRSLASERYSRCNICMSTHSNLVPCNECTVALFCNEKCENHFLHNMECKMTSFKDEGNSIAPIIRSIMVALEIFPNVDDLMNFVEQAIGSDPLEIPETLAAPQAKYRAFLKSVKMTMIVNDMSDITKSFATQLYYKTILSNRDIEAYFMSEKHKRFLMHLTCHHSDIMSCFFWSAQISIRPLLASYFDHSCAPNARILPFEGSTIVMAVRPITKGESVTVSVDPASYDRSSAERQQYIQLRYGFQCSCERCSLSSSLTTDQEMKVDPFYKAVVSNSLDISSKNGILTSMTKCEAFLNKYHEVKWSDEIGLIQHFYSLLWAARLSNTF